MIDYFKILKKSLHVLKVNKVLFVPTIIILLIHVIAVLAIVYFSRILTFINTVDNLLTQPDLFVNFFINNASRLIFLAVIYLVFVLVFDSFIMAMKYGMIKDVIKKRKTRCYTIT